MEICTIFLVEDDPWYGEILEYQLTQHPNYEVYRFRSGKDCLENLYRKPTVITLDYFLPDMNGEELFQEIRAQDSELPVIIISSQENISTAVSLLKQGVTDYLVKDDTTKDLLLATLQRIQENQRLKKEVALLRQELVEKYQFANCIVGWSQPIQQAIGQMTKASKTNITVSINGEAGTGKELSAKAIHFNSQRRDEPFISANLGAIPPHLLESELFGYEKGTFPGATHAKAGLLEQAHKGTLYLDEICRLEFNLQVKLLRALQARELSRIGSNRKVPADVRLITGTQSSLVDEVNAGTFSEDLFYHIMGLSIELPPLRYRGYDVLMLARHFLEIFCAENGLPSIQLSACAREKLMKYSFPGNVRELSAIMELGAAECEDGLLTSEHINFAATRMDEFYVQEDKTMKEYTITIIQHFLKKYDRDVMAVAEKLDIGKSTIYKMIQNNELQLS